MPACPDRGAAGVAVVMTTRRRRCQLRCPNPSTLQRARITNNGHMTVWVWVLADSFPRLRLRRTRRVVRVRRREPVPLAHQPEWHPVRELSRSMWTIARQSYSTPLVRLDRIHVRGITRVRVRRGTEKEEGRARVARRNRRRDGGTGLVPGEDGQYLLLGRRIVLATISCRLSGLAHHLKPSPHDLNEQFHPSQ